MTVRCTLRLTLNDRLEKVSAARLTIAFVAWDLESRGHANTATRPIVIISDTRELIQPIITLISRQQTPRVLKEIAAHQRLV